MTDDFPKATADLDLDGFIGYNLKRAYVIVQTDFRRALGADGFSPRVFSVLGLVVQRPEITQSEVARLLGIERSGLVALVDELEQSGHIQRQSVEGDRRIQALVPTPAGIKAYEAALLAVKTHEDALFADLTARERATLLATLRKFRTLKDP